MAKTNLERREQWMVIIQKQQTSGLSAQRFCQENDLDFNRFRYYKKTVGINSSRKSSFVKVVPRITPATTSEAPSKVTLKHGEFTICFEGHHDDSRISSLFLALRGSL